MQQLANSVNQIFSRNRVFFTRKLGHFCTADCAKFVSFF